MYAEAALQTLLASREMTSMSDLLPEVMPMLQEAAMDTRDGQSTGRALRRAGLLAASLRCAAGLAQATSLCMSELEAATAATEAPASERGGGVQSYLDIEGSLRSLHRSCVHFEQQSRLCAQVLLATQSTANPVNSPKVDSRDVIDEEQDGEDARAESKGKASQDGPVDNSPGGYGPDGIGTGADSPADDVVLRQEWKLQADRVVAALGCLASCARLAGES